MRGKRLSRAEMVAVFRAIEDITEHAALEPERRAVPRQKALNQIYRLAHSAVGTCGNPHANWREEVTQAVAIYSETGERP